MEGRSGGQGGLVTLRPTYRPNLTAPRAGRISVICPIFGRGTRFTRTSETSPSRSYLINGLTPAALTGFSTPSTALLAQPSAGSSRFPAPPPASDRSSARNGRRVPLVGCETGPYRLVVLRKAPGVQQQR